VIEAWQGLAFEDWVSGAEKLVITDFVEFVECHHAHLGPNRRLRLCGLNRDRLLSRLRAVLEQAAGTEGWVSNRDAWAVAEVPGDIARTVFLKIYLDEPTPRIGLVLYPANNLEGARRLYRDRPDHAHPCPQGRWLGRLVVLSYGLHPEQRCVG
jgi:hypothetical protein